VFFAVFVFSYSIAQHATPLINSGKVLDEGRKLHDNKKYKDAIALYKTVPRSDTNYAAVLHELSLSNYKDSNFAESKKYARLGLELFPYKVNDWYNLLANALDEEGKVDEAQKMYDSVLMLNPNDYVTLYNKGLSFYKKSVSQKRKLTFNVQCSLIHFMFTLISF